MTSINLKAAKLDGKWERSGIMYSLCADESGSRIYTAGMDGAVWSASLSAEETELKQAWSNHVNYVSRLLWHDGMVISAGYDRRLNWTRAEDGEQVRSIADAHKGWIRDVAISGSRLVSVGDDMRVVVRDLESGDIQHSLTGHEPRTPEHFYSALYAVAVTPDGRLAASGDRVGGIRVWDLQSGECLKTFQAPGFYTCDLVKRSRSIGGIRSLCFSDDGTTLAVGGIGQVTNVDGFVGPCRVELWDWAKQERTFIGEDSHQAVLNDIAFLPDGMIVGVGGGDGGGVIAFWDQSDKKATHKIKPKGHQQQFVWLDDAATLVACGYDGLQRWRLATDGDDQPATDSEKGAP